MKRFIPIVLIFAAGALAFSDNQRAVDVSAAAAGSAFLTFTDRNSYNPWDFAGSPVGLLSRLTVPVKIDLGYRLWNQHEISSNDSFPLSLSTGMIPRISVGVPQTAYLIGSYLPYIVKNDSLTMAIQRFGVILAAGSPTGIFGFAVKADGFLGHLKPDTTWYRQILDVEDVGVYLGSRMMDMLSVGVHAGASGCFDSLKHIFPGDIVQDRYFSGSIPIIGGDIDFDLPQFPLSSNFSIDFGTNYFLYATQRNGFGAFDIRAIKADSLNWNWQGMLTVKSDSIFITPAMGIGYWRSNSQLHDTAHGNQDPFNLGAAYADSTWKHSFMHWGLGGTVDYHNIVALTLEYTNGSFKVAYGGTYPTVNGSSSRQFPMHRTALGLTANLQKISAFKFPAWLDVAFRMGYFNELGDSHIDPYRGNDVVFFNDTLWLNSQGWRYLPDFGRGGYERSQRFSLGLGTSVFDHMAGLDTYIALVGKETYASLKGIEFGIDMEYQLKMPH
jgi:hypothetical protein